MAKPALDIAAEIGRADADPVAADLSALSQMDAAELRVQWRRLCRYDPPKRLSRDVLELAVAWKLQERKHGGLTASTRRQLDALSEAMASGADLAKPRTVSLRPGARLVREWNGETHEVLVVEGGFQWKGRTWPSLSIIAREMTGTRWSGPRFFGVTRGRADG